MLQIEVPMTQEGWDDGRQEFVDASYKTLQLEHSLVSLSKWEAKWHKPFLSQKELTTEETLDYIRFMTLNKNVSPDVYNHITDSNVDEILAYIKDPMTATTFSNQVKPSREIVTSELIYYSMIANGIPFECAKWHLNALMTLIRVCNVKNTPSEKRSGGDIARYNASLNAARRKQLHTRG